MGKLTIELLGFKIGHFNFRNIVDLNLQNCKIKQLDCLSGKDFRGLRKLNFDDNLVTNIDFCGTLSTLKYLSLNYNKIVRLSATAETPIQLPYLEELYLGNNEITSISDLCLSRLRSLKILHLNDNKITSVDGLRKLSGLTELVLDKNQISTIEYGAFSSVINLKSLHIKYFCFNVRDNKLKSLAGLLHLPKVQHLHLSNNRLHAMKEIENMEIPQLVEISMSNNTICRSQMYRMRLLIKFKNIQAIDGNVVTVEERQRAHEFNLEQCMINDYPLTISKTSSITSISTRTSAVKVNSLVLDLTSFRFQR
jgi:Leucine-rich repeat (LRR) protein